MKKALFLILILLLGVFVFIGCGGVVPEEPLPEPVVVAPEPEPAPPEPEPEPEIPVFRLPLSGTVVDEDDPLLHMRALAVKIENTPESRPALGITRADVVYETITEGGITRFNAIFQSDMPDDVGSVRSARNSDVTIVPQYDALFVFSGTNSLVWADLGRAGNIAFLEEGTAGKALYRVGHKGGPHNLYLNIPKVLDRFEEKWHYIYQPWPRGFEFSDQIDTSEFTDKDDAIEIFIPFSGSMFDVTWKYDPGNGKYMRYIGGKAQNDEGYGNNQIAADNVILLDVKYVPAPDVPGKGQTYNMNFNGSGTAIFFRDGVRIDCTWEANADHPPIFTDLKGNPIFYKPGKTWFQIPRDIFATVVLTGHKELDDPSAIVSEETDLGAVQDAIDADVDE